MRPWVRMASVGLLWAEWLGPLRPVHFAAHPGLFAVASVLWVAPLFVLVGAWTEWAASVCAVTIVGVLVLAGDARPGGVELRSLEAVLLAGLFLVVALWGSGRWSVDALRGRRTVDRGGSLAARWLVSAVFIGLAWSHLSSAFLSGARVEQLLWARYRATPAPGVAVLASGLVLVGEAMLGVAVWIQRVRSATVVVAVVALLLAYGLFYLGSFPALMAALLVASAEPDPKP